MKIRSLVYLFALSISFCSIAPLSYAQPDKSAVDAVQSVGSAHWRIGPSSLSQAFYIEAPANLESKRISVDTGNGIFKAHTEFVAQNESVRVEIRRAFLYEYGEMQREFFGRIGGAQANAKKINVAGYDGMRLEVDGKIAIVVLYGDDVWAAAILPQTAPGAKAIALKSANSFWLERRETPQWKDRAIGTTSFQADLPFELAPRPSQDADTVSTGVRWRNFWVDAMEWRAGNTDLDGTVKLQIENFKKQAGIENVRVKELDRKYSWGFMEGGERGKWVQIDYTEGGQPRRIYKVFSVAGTRVVMFQLSLNANDPTHLFAAHRILGTARIGWTDSAQFTPQKASLDKFEIDSDGPFKVLADQDMHVYQGTDPFTFIVVATPKKPTIPDPSETDLDAQAMVELALKDLMKAMGGTITKTRIETLAGTIFPARRIVFEAEANNRGFDGDAAMISQGRKIIFPFRLTNTASSDWARRWATTFRGDTTTPGNWPKRTFGGIEMVAPLSATASADGSQLNGEGDGIRFKVKTVAQPYDGAPNFHPGPNETSPVTTNEIEDALSIYSWQTHEAVQKSAREAGIEKTDAKSQPVFAGNAFGTGAWYAASDLKFPRLDVIALHDGRNLWTLELGWNPADPVSVQTRDAVLSSVILRDEG